MMVGEVLRAAVLASQAHVNQKRKYTNEPYVNHPMRVALAVSLIFPEDHEAVCAALLHDVIEDTEVTEEMLRIGFSGRTVKLVVETTKVSKKEDGDRAFRKAKDLEHYKTASVTGQTIKVLDRTDNVKDIVDRDPVFAIEYIQESWELLNSLTKADPVARDRLRTILTDAQNRLHMYMKVSSNV